MRNEYQAALAQENSLTAALEPAEGRGAAMNRKAIDYSVLERDVQSSRQIYDSLMQRAKETGVTGELKTSNIRVVDRAERAAAAGRARRPVLNLLLALFGGTLLACGLVFFFEYLDSRIKTPDEIRPHLGLPDLGLMPALDRKSWRQAGSAAQQRRAAGFRRGVPGAADQRAVLVRRRRARGRSSSRAPDRAKARHGGEQPGDLRSRRPASACC